MNYIGIRNYIQSGDIVAFTHIGWKSFSDIESQIIRMATRSEYSHVGLVWKIADRLFVLEAVVPEIRIFPLSNFNHFYLLSMKAPLSKEAEEYALSRVGQRYSKFEAIKGYLGINKSNEKWQCAEYVKAVLRINGILLSGTDTPTNIVRSAMEEYNAGLIVVTNNGDK